MGVQSGTILRTVSCVRFGHRIFAPLSQGLQGDYRVKYQFQRKPLEPEKSFSLIDPFVLDFGQPQMLRPPIKDVITHLLEICPFLGGIEARDDVFSSDATLGL